ncbi:hypothetical protein MSBRW_3209 [Methanosarcina barkeri str. Wiesmoor]|uniref:Uncharacterized protein n=1 Tax=Methanosarcina barkeri str. Wiesmoor TaxID=1434109 RepID=A0A0E3QQG4_METBA|nr:hypothetical protein MSBRW_3209 [Methanosarcina barkeri str. Wiesmoor]
MEEKRTKKPMVLSQVYRLKIIKYKLSNIYEIIKTVNLHSNGHSFKKLFLQRIRKYENGNLKRMAQI